MNQKKTKKTIKKILEKIILWAAIIDVFGNMILFTIYRILEIFGIIDYLPCHMRGESYCTSIAVLTLLIIKHILEKPTEQKEK